MTHTRRDYCALVINGQRHTIKGHHAFMMLADFLRYELYCSGTKIVCAEGDCGACTVLCCRESHLPVFAPINACIVTMAQLDGCHIVTVEGLKKNGSLSVVQQAMVDHHGSQCGFCTPGFVMALTALFDKQKNPSEQTIKNALTGNLCRCTGYQPILHAALSVDKNLITPLYQQFMCQKLDKEPAQSLYIKDEKKEIFAPITINEALTYKQENPSAGFLGGATDLGVSINKNKKAPDKFLSLHLMSELYDINEQDERIIIGARVTLAMMRKFLKNRCKEFASFINIFASPQIKNMATVVGNLANASPIGDTIPFFLVADGQIHAASLQGTRIIPLVNFYKGYKTTALRSDEIITHASFLLTKPSQKLKLQKVSSRKDLDISTINGAFLFSFKGAVIGEAKIALGGIDAVTKRLYNTEQFLVGKSLSQSVIDEGCSVLQQEISPISDLRGSATLRRMLAENLLRKYCHEVTCDNT